MPLVTYILRDGEKLRMPNGYGGFHVAAMVMSSSMDSGRGPFTENTPERVVGCPYEEITEPLPIDRGVAFGLTAYPVMSATPLNDGHYVLQRDWSFVDVTDGEVLRLKAGDDLVAYRS